MSDMFIRVSRNNHYCKPQKPNVAHVRNHMFLIQSGQSLEGIIQKFVNELLN